VYGGHYYAFIRAMPCNDIDDSMAANSSRWLGEEPPAPVSNGSIDSEAAQREYASKLAQWRDRRGRWYKFDDEKVYCVSESTAIDGNFGRETKTNVWDRGLGSINSAYMLVYIREREASTVCATRLIRFSVIKIFVFIYSYLYYCRLCDP
jgi:hypothetical protein